MVDSNEVKVSRSLMAIVAVGVRGYPSLWLPYPSMKKVPIYCCVDREREFVLDHMVDSIKVKVSCSLVAIVAVGVRGHPSLWLPYPSMKKVPIYCCVDREREFVLDHMVDSNKVKVSCSLVAVGAVEVRGHPSLSLPYPSQIRKRYPSTALLTDKVFQLQVDPSLDSNSQPSAP